MTSEQLVLLRGELISDPLVAGYAQMSDAQAAAKLNTVGFGNHAKERRIIETWEIVNACVPAELNALTAAQREQLLMIVSCGRVDIKATRIRAIGAALFGAQTETRANLLALQTESISRAEHLGLPQVDYWDVGQARAA